MKKILALLFSIFFCIGMLLGCGNDKQNTAEQQKQTNTIQVEQNTTSNKDYNTQGNDSKLKLDFDGSYTDKEHVAAYINQFQKLPHNYITKGEAKKLGWKSKGTLDKVAPGKSIGGDRYGNYEGLLPKKDKRTWRECDIDYVKGNRNAKRIVFSNDGLIYYTEDHYKSFTRLYQEEICVLLNQMLKK